MTELLTIAFFGLAYAIIGGIIFRMRGGWPDIPRPFEQALFCAPIIFIAVSEWGLWGLIAAALSVIAVLKGHGNNMDLGTWTKPADDEWYEFAIKWAKPYLSAYWYDALGLMVSGLTYTLPLILIAPLAAFSGALKAPAYMIGRVIAERTPLAIRLLKLKEPDEKHGHTHKFEIITPTEWGEFLTGAFIWAALSIYIQGVF